VKTATPKSVELVISIVSWNTRDLLRTCLLSLRQHCRANHTRVVVVDNASSDGTPEMVLHEFPEVTLIESGANLGFGKAHNLVAENSTEPFILFLNPDTEFVENAHEKMLRVFKQHRDVGVVGCRMTNLDGSVQPMGFQWHTSPWTELVAGLLVWNSSMSIVRRLLPVHDPLTDGYVRKVYGGCLMVRRKVLDQVGCFDERFFMYGEDVDLSRRVDQGGWSLYYLSSARVIHLCGGASAKAPGRFATLMQCESISKLMEKYHGRLGRHFYVSVILLRAVLRMVLIGIARLFALLIGRKRTESLTNSWLKHKAMLQWSLGLERPEIPR
jgi:GT2 family glycosyltransferase